MEEEEREEERGGRKRREKRREGYGVGEKNEEGGRGEITDT